MKTWASALTANRHNNFQDYLEKYYEKNRDKYVKMISEKWKEAKENPQFGFSAPAPDWFIDQVASELAARDENLFNHLNKATCPDVGDDERYFKKVREFTQVITYECWGIL